MRHFQIFDHNVGLVWTTVTFLSETVCGERTSSSTFADCVSLSSASFSLSVLFLLLLSLSL